MCISNLIRVINALCHDTFNCRMFYYVYVSMRALALTVYCTTCKSYEIKASVRYISTHTHTHIICSIAFFQKRTAFMRSFFHCYKFCTSHFLFTVERMPVVIVRCVFIDMFNICAEKHYNNGCRRVKFASNVKHRNGKSTHTQLD